MPLIKSTSKEAFGKNIGAELKAGKPRAQAVAIAYSEKRAAGGMDSDSSKHHSKHSSQRSAEYHSKTVEPNFVRHESTMATKLNQRKQSDQDESEMVKE